MADQFPWTVRAALWFVNTVDAAVATLLGTAQSVGERQEGAICKPPLAGFRHAASVGAKGAKWTVIAVIVVGTLFMFGTLVFVPRVKPTVPPSAADASQPLNRVMAPPKASADVIAGRCPAGADRSFPNPGKAECAGRPSQPSTMTGDSE